MKLSKKGEKRKNYLGSPSSNLTKDNEFLVFRELYARLRTKYDPLTVLNELEAGEIFIPLSIFNEKLSSLEVISKYLLENRNLSLKQISVLLNRTNRNIWNAYNRSKNKFPNPLLIKDSKLIPLSISRNLHFTLLENIVVYLKDILNLSYHDAAVCLQRNDRTVWTVYQRAKKRGSK